MKLYLVPTPIGNLEDITLRALRILKEVDLILVEDTRVSIKLLKHFDIKIPIESYHTYNEHKKMEHIIRRLKEGIVMALISDAGTPGISDPGFLLIRRCIQNDIPIDCLPGPTAFVPALINAGLPSDKFIFEGFLPVKKGRKIRLENLSTEMRTIILYESPYRLIKTLEELSSYLGGERKASISREMTKIFEETVRKDLHELLMYYKDKKLKGEFVIVIAGKSS